MVEATTTSEGGSKDYLFENIKVKIEKIIDDSVQLKCSGINSYDPRQGQAWSNEIAEDIVKKAQENAGKNFKLQCIAMVLNKETSGFHMSASCFWDSKQDGNINKRFDFPTFWVIVTLFGISRM